MREDDVTRLLARIRWRPTHRNPGSEGTWLDGPCPLAPWTHRTRQDRNPSFGVLAAENKPSAFICHACKHHGRLSRLFHLLSWFSGDHARYKDLVDRANQAERHGTLADFEHSRGERIGDLPEPPPDPLDEAVARGIYEPAIDVPAARQYLMRRGFSPETIEALNILADPEEGWIVHEVRGRQGELYGWTRRTWLPDGKPKVKDNDLPKRHLILGAETWTSGKPLVLVEGVFDRARLYQEFGDRWNLGALLSSHLSPEKANIVRAFDHPTVLFLDNDEAGMAGLFGPLDKLTGKRQVAKGALGQLQEHVNPLWYIDYSGAEGVEDADPDSLSGEQLRRVIRRAKRWHPRLKRGAQYKS